MYTQTLPPTMEPARRRPTKILRILKILTFGEGGGPFFLGGDGRGLQILKILTSNLKILKVLTFGGRFFQKGRCLRRLSRRLGRPSPVARRRSPVAGRHVGESTARGSAREPVARSGARSPARSPTLQPTPPPTMPPI